MWTNVLNGFSNFAMKVATSETAQTVADISEQLSAKITETFTGLDFSLLFNPYLAVLPAALTVILAFAGLGKAISLIKGTIFGA